MIYLLFIEIPNPKTNKQTINQSINH